MHPARECPKGEGKGKGKPKGKGIWEVDEGKEEAGEIGAVERKEVKTKRKFCEYFEKCKCEEERCDQQECEKKPRSWG